MKKLCILLLAILLCLPVCFPAFADMGGPEFIEYTATATSDIPYYTWEWDDATDQSYYKKAGTIPAGTELKISNEYEMDGEMYAYFFDNEKRDEDGNAFSGFVRARDLSMDGSAGNSSVTAYKQHESVRLRVTEPKGVTLYAGPSATYAEVAVIPQGSELTVDTLDQSSYDTGAWMYITYGNKHGWARCWLYDGTACPMAELLPKGETGTVWVVKDNAVLKDRKGNDLITVPKGEKLTFDSFNRSPHEFSYYVTYAGKTGAFTVNDDGYDNVVASNRNGSILYSPSVSRLYIAELYKYPDDKVPVGMVRYQPGDTFESEFLYYAEPDPEYRGGIEWNYVEKGGQSGWIKTDSEKLDYPEDDYSEFPRDIPELYWFGEDESSRQIQVRIESVTDKAETSSAQPDGATDADTSAIGAESTQTADADVSQASESLTSEPETETVAVSGRPLSPTGFIGVCIGAAAVLALTAVVSLCLIRRKKAD